MPAEHRRDLYSAVSPDARQLSDASGPDGVRVTIRVEPAVDRLKRWRRLWFVPDVLTDPARTYVDYRVLPGFVQKHVLGNRWAVEVEADSGERCRVKASSRDQAVDYARRIHDGVTSDGIAFLGTFAR